MPYRRLPNTDVTRLKALYQAYQKGKELPPFKLAFSQATFCRVQSFLPGFDKMIRLYKSSCATSIAKNKEYPANFRKAKLYISHFIQVMNMSIARGELNPNIRTFFGIDEQNNKVPEMNTEADVIKWGEQIIAGEAERMKRGMTPIANPSIALVRVRFDQFINNYRAKKINQKNNIRILNDVIAMRNQADAIILSIWNEVEKHFANLPDDLMREKSAEYGLSYVFRKNELQHVSQFE